MSYDEKREEHWLVLTEKESSCLDAHSKKDTLVTSELIRLSLARAYHRSAFVLLGSRIL